VETPFENSDSKVTNLEVEMAIDFEALRRKLGQLSGNNSRRNVMWRPQEGETSTVRLIAFPDNDGQPFAERWFYYGIGANRGLLTPHQFGKPDPFQELINKLRDDGSKESYELAKKLYPKMRSYALVVVRGEEDKGVRIWSFGKTVYQELLNIMLDEDFGDITDPLEGFDVKVECVKQPGRKWANTSVRARPRSSALSDDKKQIKEWMDNLPSLDELYTCKSYEELEKIINEWLDAGAPDEDTARAMQQQQQEQRQESSDNPFSADQSEGTSSTKYKDLDDAFNDLANF